MSPLSLGFFTQTSLLLLKSSINASARWYSYYLFPKIKNLNQTWFISKIEFHHAGYEFVELYKHTLSTVTGLANLLTDITETLLSSKYIGIDI